MFTSLDIVQMEVGLGQNLVEILACPATKKAALIDPALEVDRILDRVEEGGLAVEAIFVTHTHEDHIAGLDEAYAATKAPVYTHPGNVETLKALAEDVRAVEDEAFTVVGQGRVQAIYTPGHLAECICWYTPEAGALFTGDVLFIGSCGGVNYPGSDPRAMVDSLQRRLGALPEETRVYPGHDFADRTTSTLAWEFAHNPALLADTLAKFCAYKQVPVPQ